MWLKLSVGLAMLGIELWNWRERRNAAAAAGAEDGDAPLRSLVFLLDEPRTIEPGAWVKQLGDALGAKLDSGDGDATEFLLQMPHPAIPPEDGDCFMLQIPAGNFWVFNIRKPYMDDPGEFAEGIRDRRLRDAVARHRAWISVDLLRWIGPEDRTAIYAVIGKALAALAGPDVLAVNAPELGRCNEFEPSIIERLASGDPLSIFDDPTHAPVLNIEGDDPQMKAAVTEARRRWPEFAGYFAQRDASEDRPFIIKAPFGKEGDEEFMWVLVEGIDDGLVRGKLANQPHRIIDMHEGQDVTVPADAVVDWMCADASDQPLGGWTQKVLARRPE